MKPITEQDARKITSLAPAEAKNLNAGIVILYQDGKSEIGVSHETAYDGKTGQIYIFNIFIGSEYINIPGQYRESELQDPKLIKTLTETWNLYSAKERN